MWYLSEAKSTLVWWKGLRIVTEFTVNYNVCVHPLMPKGGAVMAIMACPRVRGKSADSLFSLPHCHRLRPSQCQKVDVAISAPSDWTVGTRESGPVVVVELIGWPSRPSGSYAAFDYK
jgi:hypothetical protein